MQFCRLLVASVASTLPAAPPVRFDGRSRARSSRCDAAAPQLGVVSSSIRLRRRSVPPRYRPLAPSREKTNDEVIAGGVAYRAHERCWPAGVPTFDTDVVGAPLFIYQRPNEIVVIMQSGPEVRHIYLNVPHSANPKPSWYGESVGHYEGGDTLVIDTIGQTDKTFADNYRTPHTTQMHVIERWKLSADGNRVDVSVTVDDPGAFTTSYEGAQRWRRVQVSLEELICAENNAQDFLGFKVPIPQSSKPDF
jgi:hypothetical protein